jgi:hypothetical protein
MWRADVAAYGIASLQVELAYLRRRDIDVVRTWQIVVVRRAQKAVAVGQDLEDAFGKDMAFFFALSLENLKDQVLFAEAGGSCGNCCAEGVLKRF